MERFDTYPQNRLVYIPDLITEAHVNRISTLVLLAMSLPLSACASVSGQVGHTSYWSLPKNVPAALPKAKTKDGKDPETYLPFLGQFVSGSLGAKRVERSFGYWDDPSAWQEVSFTSVLMANAPIGPAEYSPKSVTLSSSVGVKIGAANIPVKGGQLNLLIRGTREFELKNLRMVRLKLTYDYLLGLLNSYREDKEGFFVSSVVAADVSADSAAGLKIGYEPAPGSTLPEAALQADYERNYSGIGLIVGLEFQKIIGAANRRQAANATVEWKEPERTPPESFRPTPKRPEDKWSDLTEPRAAPRFEPVDPKQSAEFEQKAGRLGFRVDLESSPYLWNRQGDKGVQLVFTGFTGSSFGRVLYLGGTNSERNVWSKGNSIVLNPGEHVLTFVDLLGSRLLSADVRVYIFKDKRGKLVVRDLRGPTQRILSWEGYRKGTEE